jgi:hypothetical protein
VRCRCNHAERARQDPKIGKGKADAYGDYRKVLERKDIDVVSVVTPDHWHVKIAIEALQAGKHVFCQKPLTLTLEENQLVRNACKKYPGLGLLHRHSAAERPRPLPAGGQHGSEGPVGRHQEDHRRDQRRRCRRRLQEGGSASQLELDMWLGQAPKVDYIKQRCHDQFRWWYEYSGGKFTDWLLTMSTSPRGRSTPTRMAKGRRRSTAPTRSIRFRTRTATPPSTTPTTPARLRGEVRVYPSGLEMIVTSRGDNGILFEGDKGRLFVNRGKITGTPIDEQWDKDKFTPDDLGAALQGQAVRRPQAELLPLHQGRRPTGLRRVHARSGDGHLPLGGDRGPVESRHQVGSEGREDRRRRAGRGVRLRKPREGFEIRV